MIKMNENSTKKYMPNARIYTPEFQHETSRALHKSLRRSTDEYSPNKWGSQDRDFYLYIKSSENGRDLIIVSHFSDAVRMAVYPFVRMLTSPIGLSQDELFTIVGKHAKTRGFVADYPYLPIWKTLRKKTELLYRPCYAKSEIKSSFTDRRGKVVISVLNELQHTAEVINESGNSLFFDWHNLGVESNNTEFFYNTPDGSITEEVDGITIKRNPEVINIQVLSEIEEILFETASDLTGRVDYLIFQPSAFVLPSVEQVRSLHGEPELLPSKESGCRLYKFRVKRDEVEDFIIVNDRSNTGYVIPYMYTRTLRFKKAKSVPEIKGLVESDLSFF